MKVSVEIPPAVEEQLTRTAERLKVSVDDLAAAAVRDLIAQPDDDFERAATRVLEKNRELYRRLAEVRYLTLAEVLELHARVISQTGGLDGLRDVGALESAVAQQREEFLTWVRVVSRQHQAAEQPNRGSSGRGGAPCS
jgi:hypothetical protein